MHATLLREVNSLGSSPAVGRFAPSSMLLWFPRIIETMPLFVPDEGSSRAQIGFPNSGQCLWKFRQGQPAEKILDLLVDQADKTPEPAF